MKNIFQLDKDEMKKRRKHLKGIRWVYCMFETCDEKKKGSLLKKILIKIATMLFITVLTVLLGKGIETGASYSCSESDALSSLLVLLGF